MNLFDLPIETAETTTVATLDEGDFVEGIVAHPNGVRVRHRTWIRKDRSDCTGGRPIRGLGLLPVEPLDR